MSNRVWILLIALILVLSLLTGMIFYLRPRGTQVVVTVSGEVFASYDLKEDRTVVIAPADGSWHNTLKIAEGKAAVIEADCDNQICVHTPALTEETVSVIACLPHGLTVEIK